MLQFLRVEHFLHVRKAEITFGDGLHCITGESGSGKTVILKALKLLFGEKTLPNVVTEGENQAVIEAAFDITFQTSIHKILEMAGITYDKEEWLLIKRIIPQEGRSRIFINSQTTNMLILEKLGKLLVEIVDQHAGKQLISHEYQRHLLDTFGQHTSALVTYSHAYTTYHKALEKLYSLQASKPELIDTLLWQKEELEKHKIHELNIDEQLELHEKYSHAEETAASLSQIIATLREHTLSQLLQMTRLHEKIAENNPELKQISTHLQTAQLEIEEAASLSEQYLDSLHFDPEEFARLEELSSFLSLFKRKHGVSYENIKDTYHDIVDQITLSLEKDKWIDEQQHIVEHALEQLKVAAETLTTARITAAESLGTLTSSTLQTLKMEDITFEISVTREEYKKSGQDIISFQLHRGKQLLPIGQVASGGELSRILLAIKAHIATKQSTPTLIFDEIDSNIGGETANVVAELLYQAAEAQQLLTITHFPQVAAKADHHIVVEKKIEKNGSFGFIRLLNQQEKKNELLRMVGGKNSAILLTSEAP